MKTENQQPALVHFRKFIKEENLERKEFYEIEQICNDKRNQVEDEASKKMYGEFCSFLKRMKKNSKSVVMVIDKKYLTKPTIDNGVVTIKSKALFERSINGDYSICPSTDYAQQHSAFSVGSGFFIKKLDEEGGYVIGTAAHVVVNPDNKFSDLRFVHGIIAENNNRFDSDIKVHKSQIFEPIDNELPYEAYRLSSSNADWALVSVKRAYDGLENIQPEIVSLQNDEVQKRTLMYSIGHGLNLPMKFSYRGKIKRMNKNYFECDLMLLGGNSGSPVFNAETHELIGIYARGTKKLMLSKKTCDNEICLENGKCLVVKNETNGYEGQECQQLNVVKNALEQIVSAAITVAV